MARHKIRLGANALAQKWADATNNGTNNYKAGVMAVTQSPGPAAAARKDAYLAGVQAKADKWAARLNNLPLATWQQGCTNKGMNRIPDGVKQGQPKMNNFFQQVIPYIDSGIQGLNNTNPRGPKGSPANKQRMSAWMDYMMQFKRQ